MRRLLHRVGEIRFIHSLHVVRAHRVALRQRVVGIIARIGNLIVVRLRDGSFLIVVVAETELAVAVVHELSPAVGCPGQHVIEAFVVLHQEGEHVIIGHFFGRIIIGLYFHFERQHLQMCGAGINGSFGCRMFVVLQLRSQDLRQPLAHEGAAGLFQLQHHVGAADGQLQAHRTLMVFRGYLVDVVVVANRCGIRVFIIFDSKLHVLVLEGLHVFPFDSCPCTARIHADVDVCQNHSRLIHLHVDVKTRQREIVFFLTKLVSGCILLCVQRYFIVQFDCQFQCCHNLVLLFFIIHFLFLLILLP